MTTDSAWIADNRTDLDQIISELVPLLYGELLMESPLKEVKVTYSIYLGEASMKVYVDLSADCSILVTWDDPTGEGSYIIPYGEWHGDHPWEVAGQIWKAYWER